jgi:hypothetical protein
MQQRQLRLGDILDDYCPRERRLTNHAVVAMIGPDVKQTRCTTCDAEHEYKHGKVPRQRRKADTPAALYSQIAAGGPKRVAHDPADDDEKVEAVTQDALKSEDDEVREDEPGAAAQAKSADAPEAPDDDDAASDEAGNDGEEGPVHRPLIRATLPRPEGQPPPPRPAPDFTIRHPGGRPNRFRHRAGRGGTQFQGNRSNGNFGGGASRGGGAPRPGGGRPPHTMSPRTGRRHGPKRQK